ncbi:EscU/YscU/HrcU family type III secretion system export apparatus switch protein [Kordiimonas sp. SCSIO 12610]|uniref:EscU/YscU/HrcU family type III secretion system export apparatus switch protein n=1 Tax=Kordiimonas sp. SCSIO 12610 TaxID=2829597 RepID=UPI00210D9FC4|nr:EscU/YscU/HrcU family type III secretion system export apparatus switch protein [Kordiimonas sp. SCSIO 12610]UTW56814.1 EscU/YscU/HrcU family type III secretion system export apparatus switch protein [Kordiimonas sp. SCSIO 12610]
MNNKPEHTDILKTKAVAVKKNDNSLTPRITAKGKGYNAEKILDIAFAEGVKVRQDSELTDILDQFEIDSPIPLEALHTVSLILEKVYEHEKRLDGGEKSSNKTNASHLTEDIKAIERTENDS